VKTGFAIFAHGSAIESANQGVCEVARRFAVESGFELVEPAFLELGQPDLAGAISRLIQRGAGRIVVIPYFLTLGTHLQRDLPRIVEDISSIHRDVPIVVAPPLDGHPGLLAALLDRARQAL
jgi:sirohydrochlorin ferrochelatase